MQPGRTVVLTLLFVMLTAAASAQHTVFEYRVDASVNDVVVDDYINQTGFGPLDLTAEEVGAGVARGWADVGVGVNRTLSQFSGFRDEPPVWHAYASGYSQWYDVLTISDPTLDGTLGRFTTTMRVTGSGFFNVSDSWVQSSLVEFYGLWNSRVEVATDVGGENENWQSDGWGGFWEANADNSGVEYSGDALNTNQRETMFDFTYGDPFVVGGWLQTYLFLANPELVPGSMEATLDLSNSAHWAGIRELFDASGLPVTGAVLRSRSGIDWLNLGLEPDYNQNGVVDAADYAVWRKGLGTSYTQNDYNVWRAQFGQTTESGATGFESANTAVPEPTTPAMLVMTIMLIFARQRARKS
jgi:hypothetical protein